VRQVCVQVGANNVGVYGTGLAHPCWWATAHLWGLCFVCCLMWMGLRSVWMWGCPLDVDAAELAGQLDRWAAGVLGSWIAGQLDSWAAGLMLLLFLLLMPTPPKPLSCGLLLGLCLIPDSRLIAALSVASPPVEGCAREPSLWSPTDAGLVVARMAVRSKVEGA
jgi:hypothetical protein